MCPYRIDGRRGRRSYNIYKVKRKSSRSVGRKRRTFSSRTAARRAGYALKYVKVGTRKRTTRRRSRGLPRGVGRAANGRFVSLGRRASSPKRSAPKRRRRASYPKRRGIHHYRHSSPYAYSEVGNSHMYRDFWG